MWIIFNENITTNLQVVFLVAVESAFMSAQLEKTDKTGEKQVFSGVEDAMKTARHAAHVSVTAGGRHRQRVEDDA